MHSSVDRQPPLLSIQSFAACSASASASALEDATPHMTLGASATMLKVALLMMTNGRHPSSTREESRSMRQPSYCTLPVTICVSRSLVASSNERAAMILVSRPHTVHRLSLIH